MMGYFWLMHGYIQSSRCRLAFALVYFHLFSKTTPHHIRFTAIFQDHLGEPVPEENLWTLWCKGKLTEADTPTIRLTSAHLHHPPFFTGRMPFLPPNQQCQSTEGKRKRMFGDNQCKYYTGRIPSMLANEQCQCTEGNSNN